MRRIRFCAIFLLLLLFLYGLPVLAAGKQRLIDEDDLLTEDERELLSSRLDEASNRNGIDIVILTTESLDGETSEAYADDYYDENGYSEDGILLLVAMEEREYAISTKGTPMYVFTQDALRNIEDDFLPDLSDGYYYNAFDSFISDVDTYYYQHKDDDFSQYEYGGNESYVDGDQEREKPSIFRFFPISAILGIVFSFFSTGQKKSALTSVDKQNYASNYVINENMTKRNDVFLYHTVTRNKKPKDRDRDHDGGFSGGHISSSGSTHGGSHGHF